MENRTNLEGSRARPSCVQGKGKCRCTGCSSACLASVGISCLQVQDGENCAGNKEFPSVVEKDKIMCEPPILMNLCMLKIIKECCLQNEEKCTLGGLMLHLQ